MAYQSRSKSATQGKEETAQMDYTHTEAHQMAYDFSVYLHEKMKKFPHYEKFTLQKDIRESIDGILDEIEMFEITKVASHLYAADRLKRRLVRKIRLAYDLGYSAMNKDAYFYCAKQTGAIGAQIGGLIKSIAEKKEKIIKFGATVNSHFTRSLAAAIGTTAFTTVRARSTPTITRGTSTATLACGACVTCKIA